MIINTGQRTDIPAFYSRWFMNRLREGYVMARNPFDPHEVYRYSLHPDDVDALFFCTKNPSPMIPFMEKLKPYRQIWHVTITAYGKELEPFVPPVHEVITSFRKLSEIVGKECIFWRYDPILISPDYPLEKHIDLFTHIADGLSGYTGFCIFSFIDLYRKTIRNFPEVRRVSHEEQYALTEKIASIGKERGISLISCLEDPKLSQFGADTSGCLTKERVEKALGVTLRIPAGERGEVRKGCTCLLGHDIGAYNSCPHFCRYCYANYDRREVMENRALHDADSPLLIGHLTEEDRVIDRKGKSWIDREGNLFL